MLASLVLIGMVMLQKNPKNDVHLAKKAALTIVLLAITTFRLLQSSLTWKTYSFAKRGFLFSEEIRAPENGGFEEKGRAKALFRLNVGGCLHVGASM